MPMPFESFRLLNGSGPGNNVQNASYDLCSDKDGNAPMASVTLVRNPNPLATGTFVGPTPPPAPAVRSVKITTLSGQNPAPPLNWVLTSAYDVDDEIRSVDVYVELYQAGPPVLFMATARLYFHDTMYEEFVRFFS